MKRQINLFLFLLIGFIAKDAFSQEVIIKKRMLKTKLIMEVRKLGHTNLQTTKPQDQELRYQISIVIV